MMSFKFGGFRCAEKQRLEFCRLATFLISLQLSEFLTSMVPERIVWTS